MIDSLRTICRSSAKPRAMKEVMVVVPRFGSAKVAQREVDSLVCNRILDGEEQYLVKWKRIVAPNAYSWHYLPELTLCLALLQDYLKARRERIHSKTSNLKRKSPHAEQRAHLYEHDPQSRSPSVQSSSSESISAKAQALSLGESYNCTVYPDGDHIRVRSSLRLPCAERIPTAEMMAVAATSSTRHASHKIRTHILKRLKALPGPEITYQNIHDASDIPLRFEFIEACVLREGLTRVDPETIVGCQKECRPNMGKNIGCQLSICECLEFAAVQEGRLNEEQWVRYRSNPGDTAGLPKRFPYHTSVAQRDGCLVEFYLRGRHPIYECNHRCNCGPGCNNRMVQHGRQLPLEIFKTKDRGWGLRCPLAIRKGQFIDTYRGEIITDEEADRREARSGKGKESYLYALDKFEDELREREEAPYVVDGEHKGGPTRFMNHSCDPNVLQYTVSYNKYDQKVYDLAFFARRDIPANEELSFDYLDKDEEDNEAGTGVLTSQVDDVEVWTPDDNGTVVPCRCGAEKCRKVLWT
ncbi:SET domain-containing protein [Eremomyces bilateralis CBS 781.70]|uniref:SET domain-containing protein n=1 Tax=Eremomyces bilateralis CBS 781.70 TaxID=1392243 RepID=A0A6G1G8E3_9PEZI|nr:SET domain-containing protein [Eremomyces bilateralis CBS 781.70]KAF1814337.1 SET domain-containing protein [Eremomyces bilateralis CBS 781.70]